MNDNVLNDASIDINEGLDSSKQLDLSNDASKDISNDADTSSSAGISDMNISESQKNKLGANQLSANIDVYGTSFTDIQTAINNANYGDVIYLRGQTYTGTGQINIPNNKNNIIIRGGSQSNPDSYSTLRAYGSGILYIEGNGITLENIIFTGGHAQDGGAISTTDGGAQNCRANNCAFINNTAEDSGGALKIRGAGWTFQNCTFRDNSANPNSNSAYLSDVIDHGGGAIWSCNGLTSLINCTFDHNNATFGGALRGAFNGANSTFTNNTAYNGNGGGVDMTVNFDLVHDITRVRLDNCTFIGNDARGNYSPSSLASGGCAQGGAIHIYRIDHMVLDNVTCYNNTAYRGGGIDLFVMNSVNITNCDVQDNNATFGGGVAVVGNNTLFRNVTMSHNNALASEDPENEGQGGGIWVIGHHCTMLNSTFDYNTAEGQGGGAWINGSDVQLNDSTLNSNIAYADVGSMGGGLFVEGDGVIIHNNEISNNSADSFYGMGGGIAVTGSHCIFTDNNVTFNSADFGGGAIVDGEYVNFTNNNLSSNIGHQSGGGFMVDGQHLYVEDLYAFNNTAQNGGAMAVMDGDNLIVKNSTFLNNSAIGDLSDDRGEGGAIHLSDTQNALIQGDFANNSACNGSAIYVDHDSYGGDPSSATIVNSTFFENQAYSHILNITPEVNTTHINQTDNVTIFVSHGGGDNVINAIYNDVDCTVRLNNVTYPFYLNGREFNKTSPTEYIVPKMGAENSNNGTDLYQDLFENNQIINILVLDENGNPAKDKNGNVLRFDGLKTDIYGTVNVTLSDLIAGNYTVEAEHPEDRYYTYIYNYTTVEALPPEECDVTINKTVNASVCYVDQNVTWNITVINLGDALAENVLVNDTLPAGLELVEVICPDGTTFNNLTGVWDIGNLEVDSPLSLILVTRVLVNGTLVNNATVNTTTKESNYTNNNASNSTRAYKPGLTVRKIANDKEVYVGNVTSFVVVVTNTGDCDLGDVYVVDADYSKGLIYNGYSNSSREWNRAGNNWTLVGSLAVGQSANFTVFFTVNATGVLTNNVTAGSNLTNETNGTNKTRAFDPSLTVRKITNEKVVYVGEIASFTIVVTNNGDNELGNVYVIDQDYSKGLEFVRYENSSREWNRAGNNWTLVGPLAPGQSANFTVFFRALVNGTLVNNVTAGSNLTNETNATNKTTAYKPSIAIQKIANQKVVYVGNVTSFTIVVTNTGDCDLGNVYVVDNKYDGGLRYVRYENSSADKWNYDGNYNWTLVGSLAPGQSANFTVYFRVLTNGTLVNNATTGSNLTNETNGTNNTTSQSPGIAIHKIANDKLVYVGNVTSFTIVVTNTGNCELGDVYVIDNDYDTGLRYVRYENSSADKWNYDGNSKWTLVGSLASGQSANFTVYFRVLTNGTLVNNATTGSNLTNETNGTNNTTGKPICDLIISKSVNCSECLVDDTVMWNITVLNNGPSTAMDVIVEDILPDGIELLDATPTKGIFNSGNVWDIGTLEKDTPVSLILVTKLLAEGTFVNQAIVSTSTEESNSSNNYANASTKAKLLCDLAISKSVSSKHCYINDTVTWNVSVVNKGPHNASNVIVKDIMPKGLKLVNYSVSVGNFNEVISEWSIGTLGKDETASLILVTEVLINGTFVNIATVNTTTPEENYTNNIVNNTTNADPVCDLVIVKFVNAKKVYYGDLVIWTVKVNNDGPCDALNVKVKDILPKGLIFNSYRASIGKYNEKTGIWTIGKLANGSSATITLVTKASGIGEIINFASVNTTVLETNYSNNKANNSTVVEPVCDLVLKKSSDKTKYNVNETMHWIIEVVNKGPCGAIGAYVEDALPSGTEFVSYKASKGTFDATEGVWSIGDLARGEKVTLDILCKAIETGNFTNNATVFNEVTELDPSNNRDNATIEIVNETEQNPPESHIPLLPTGNPLVILLIALCAIGGSMRFRNRK